MKAKVHVATVVIGALMLPYSLPAFIQIRVPVDPDAAKTIEAAVRDAQQEKALLPSYQYWARKEKNDYLALALSNRAVLHWMSSDSVAAANDLKRAESLSPKADFVTRNRQALEYSHTSPAMAQVSVASGPHGTQGN